jgi:hypothetical protein
VSANAEKTSARAFMELPGNVNASTILAAHNPGRQGNS